MHAAAQAYRKVAQTGLQGRTLEATLLLQFARELEHLPASHGTDSAEFRRALFQNRDLWTMFAGDVTEETSPHGAATKADMVKLAAFVMKQTHVVLFDPHPQNVAPLVRLNRTIAEGLSTPIPAGSVDALPGPRP